MKKLISSSLALAAISLSSASYAQDEAMPEIDMPTSEEKAAEKKGADDVWFHADANIALMQLSDTDGNVTSVSDNLTASYFRAGVKYKYFGAEVELGQGLAGIDEDGLEFDLDSQTSVFGILRYPDDKYDVFIRAGYHSSTFELSDGLTTVDIDSDGFVAGIGGTYYFSQNFGLRADITGYNTRDIVEAGFVGGSIGISARF